MWIASHRATAVEPFSLVFNSMLQTYTNVHAITWFADHVWPLVCEAGARATLTIVDREPRAGMQNKLVEFMAAAKPVVATTVANEGIGAKAGEHLLLADTAGDFAKAVFDLLGDQGRRRTLGGAAEDVNSGDKS